jgi:nicotinate-nucleotide adenylyltransferase
MAHKIGIFGGTFDPVHHGHLILARTAAEEFGLDKVVLVPAALNPHKSEPGAAPGFLRLEMLRAATEGESLFEIDDQELRRDAPSYTIDTVEAWRLREPGSAIFLLIGGDNVIDLPAWHRYEDLRALIRFIVLDRPGNDCALAGASFLDRPVDISATEIRNRVAKQRSIRYLVPDSVRALIETHNLYSG